MARSTTADRGPVRQRLTAAREARGLDRAQAAAGAGISLRYLTMLEEGEYPLVSDPAYLSPFIRRYATFLDLPAEETVVAFLSETEVAERVAAASTPLPPAIADDEPDGRGRGLMIAAGAVAIALGVAVALLDVSTARTWLESFRPSVESFGGTVDRGAASVGRLVARVRSAAGSWIGGETSSPVDPPGSPVEVASSAPATRALTAVATGLPAVAAPTEAPAPPPALGSAPGESPEPAVDPPAPPVPAATTPVQPSAAAAAPTPRTREPNRLELLATARQVFVWATVDGGSPREVELRRGESASFEARRELLLTLDDAGGVLATLNGKRLPPLGAPGYGKRNIRIPLAGENGRRSASR